MTTIKKIVLNYEYYLKLKALADSVEKNNASSSGLIEERKGFGQISQEEMQQRNEYIHNRSNLDLPNTFKAS